MNFLSKFSGIAAILGALLVPNMANAEGFALQDWSARGAALAGGLVARGGDASAVAYNPAAITELEGTQIMVGTEFIVPHNIIEYTHPLTGASGSQKGSNNLFIVPHGYATHKFNDNLSFGVGAFSRFGLGNDYDSDWAGAANMYHVYLLTSTINPVVAWRVNDMLSLAAGVEISGAQVTLRQNFTPLSVYPGYGNLNGLTSQLASESIAYAFGFNLGAHLRFNEQWSAGLTYRSAISYDFDGELEMHHALFGKQYTTGSTTLNLPQEVKLAVAYAPTDKLSFEAGVAWYGWSAYEHLDIKVDNAPFGPFQPHNDNPKDWKDTWMVGLSAEYKMTDWLTLRGGVSYETSPVPSHTAEYMAPTNGRFKYSVGVGIQEVEAWAFDFAYIYHDLNSLDFDETYAQHPTSGVLPGQSKDVYAHTIAMSITYKF